MYSCCGWSWDHLQWTLCENCSHDPLASAILQEHQCIVSSVWFKESLMDSWCALDTCLMHFWCAFWLHSTNPIWDCIQWTLLEADCMLFLFLSLIKNSYFPNQILITFRCIFDAFLMHFWCIFDALLMHFWYTFGALLMHFSKVHQSASKCIKSASKVHQKCITNFDIVHLNFSKI